MEYVEVTVTDRSVESAIATALEELGLESRDQANIEVLDEGVKGFLGIGGRDAVVKVSRKPKRRRRRRRGSGSGGDSGEQRASSKRSGDGRSRSDKGRADQRQGSQSGSPKKERTSMDRAAQAETDDNVEDQVQMVEEFLKGLIASLGLEGAVSARVDDGIIKAEITGDQTEVLVGHKGSMIRTVQELARTVLQRKSPRPRRVIVDIAGYGARRREALAIYAQRLAESVLAEGGEIMLEPMTSADRKVVHDTIADIENVRSYSEGEDPRRCVIIAVVEGYVVPAGAAADEAGSETQDDAFAEVDADDADDVDDANDMDDDEDVDDEEE